ncbi:MAG: hypothetical protein LBJ18_00370 [Rickettsiales bacterium]|jgi:S-DNA-T family DNA segregation ATPase FtsK/SpoIIIE|nr:hypothetical protein [Rickettsiales bacterium]
MICPHCHKPIPDEVADEQLYQQAVDLIMNGGEPSIAFIQRKLAIGYNKAAGFIEKMESDGIISALDTNGIRTIKK